MIKKIFFHIIIFILLILPNSSFANIYGITLTNPKDDENSSSGVTVYSTITQTPNTGKTVPEGTISAGFFIANAKDLPNGGSSYMPCSSLPNNNSLTLRSKTRETTLNGETRYLYDLSYTYNNIQVGQKYYYCVRASESTNNIVLSSVAQSFVVKPSIDFKAESYSVDIGGSTKIIWSTGGANGCRARGTNDTSWSGVVPTSGEKKIEKIYENLTLTLECYSQVNDNDHSTQKTIQIKVKGLGEDKIGKVVTLPKSGGGEPEVVVEVTDKTAKLKGRLESALAGSGNVYGYFRISKVKLAPLFCNDIFGSNMIAVTANTKGGKIDPGVDFTGNISTLEPDTDYAYCAMVSNHPTKPTEIEYGQVVRFRTNPCDTCPHTTIRTLRPAQISTDSVILQGNYNSIRNLKVWFEYRRKPFTLQEQEQTETDQTFFQNINNLKLFVFSPINSLNTSKYIFNKIVDVAQVSAADDLDKWIKILPQSESLHIKKRNYGRKTFTLAGLSKNTIYEYRIMAETQEKGPNPNKNKIYSGNIIEFRTKLIRDNVNPLAHCYNGIQDFGETGIDVGGGCPGKNPSCFDGIKNQGETEIDKGGPCIGPLPTCTDGIQNGNETGIDSGPACEDELDSCSNGVQDFGETGIDTGGPCGSDPDEGPECPEGYTGTFPECTPTNCPPNFTGTPPNCIPPPLPTCADGVQNQDETGVDIGGVCGNLPPNCTDGIQNGNETGVDTGGSCGNGPLDKVTVDITARDLSVPYEGSTTISWTSKNATSCVVSGYGNGRDVGTSGGFSPIDLKKTTSWTATCTGPNGTGSDTVTVRVIPLNEIVTADITATPTYINKTGLVTVAWTSQNATSCLVSGIGVGGQTGLSGSLDIVGIKKSTSWSVVCTGANGKKATDTARVTVGNTNVPATCFDGIKNGTETAIDIGPNCPKNEPRVTVDISALPTYVLAGDPTTISWTSKNATSCALSGKGISSQTGLSGSLGIPDIDKTQSWSVTCSGPNGSASDSVTVYTYKPSEILTVKVTAEKTVLKKGEKTKVSWTSTNAESCTSGNGGGTGTSGTFETASLNASKTYSVVCVNNTKNLRGSGNVYVYVNTNTGDGNGGNGGGNGGGGGGGNGNPCGVGWVLENGSCVPTRTCPSNSTGIWPNCKFTSAPNKCPTTKGWSGDVWPNCKYTPNGNPCPKTTGWTGDFWPNCKYDSTGNACPTGYTGVQPNCKIITVCPSGTTGTYPNCKPVSGSCPEGWTGTYPNCKFIQECPSGTTGEYPDCDIVDDPCIGPDCNTDTGGACPLGTSGIYPNCTENPTCPFGYTGNPPTCVASQVCPSGTTGTYPNCKFIDDNSNGNPCPKGLGWSGTNWPACKYDFTNGGGNGNTGPCPKGSGWSGTNWPNCKYEFNGNGTGNTGPCPKGLGWSGTNWPACKYDFTNGGGNGNTGPCPKGSGWSGTNWPNCKYEFGGNGDGNGNNTCPNGMTGTYPNCKFTQTCPIGFTGTWPVCTSGPTTDIAHCSNGVQDFGETAIDIGGGCGGVYTSGFTCFDNIKNGDETGIDEGGHCGDGPGNNGEYPSCFDNIKNGDETGIDTGGHCGDFNDGTDWVDVVFPNENGTGVTTGNCVNGVCTGEWEGNFPGLNGPFNGSCQAGQYKDCTFQGNCVNGECTGTWNGNFGGENGPFIGVINGGVGEGRGLDDKDWIDSVFNKANGEGFIRGNCINGVCTGTWVGVCSAQNEKISNTWQAQNATGPYSGEIKNKKCNGDWNGVIPGNNGQVIGKWNGDGDGNGNNDKELYLGYEGEPDVDDIVRYHEGIEHVFIRRIMLNTELARHYGYKKGDNLLHFAWDLAHKLAKEFGYVDATGKEIRVSQPDVSAYQLRLKGDKITVYEFYKNKVIDVRDRTTIFKDKNSYEYYFVK